MSSDHKAQHMTMWRVSTVCEKRDGDWTDEDVKSGRAPAPYEVIERSGNMCVYGGASAIWDRLINSSPSVTVFDNTNSYIGVGDGVTAEAATQTDLQGTNKTRKAMDATYPTHTDGTGSASNAQVTFQSTFGSSDANYAWQEWAIFNASSSGRMLNRKVESWGTKVSGVSWTFRVVITIS